ncbi:hypothetical protein ABEI22_21895 [Erwinia billingiae]|uniref:hypothetical protein n=1 Tax=Erwinia billingiae TaxID=182337 RepID=UPI003208DDBF
MWLSEPDYGQKLDLFNKAKQMKSNFSGKSSEIFSPGFAALYSEFLLQCSSFISVTGR